jgi:hypothetical protein
VTFIWAFLAAGIITLLPLWEGRETLVLFAKFCFGKTPKHHTSTEGVVVAADSEASSSDLGEKGLGHHKVTTEV